MKKKIILGLLLLFLLSSVFCEERRIVATNDDFTYSDLINIFLLEMDKVKYQYQNAVCLAYVDKSAELQDNIWSVKTAEGTHCKIILLCTGNDEYAVAYYKTPVKLPKLEEFGCFSYNKETSNVLTSNGLYHFSADMYFTFKQFLNKKSEQSLQNNGLTMSFYEESVELNAFLQALYEMYKEQLFR